MTACDRQRPARPLRVARPRLSYATSSVVLALVLVGGLIAYKAIASLHVLQSAAATGVFYPRTQLTFGEAAGAAGFLTGSTTYLAIVWPALLFGILISGAVRTLVSPRWLADCLGRGPLRAQVAAATVAGAPLMLCSCCVAPIFTTVYERCRRLAPSLALMLAAPSLNPAALVLTFMFFAPAVAWTRLVLALTAVFVVTLFTARLVHTRSAASIIGVSAVAPLQTEPLALAFLRSSVHVTVRTLPLIVIGIVTAMAVADWLPLERAASAPTTALSVALAASIALPLALPTFFEVPLALTLLGAGAPSGVAVAVLFAGPAVNLPSLLTIAHATSWKVGATVAAVIWTLAVIGGLVAG